MVAAALTAHAQVEVFNFPVGIDVPDNDPSGIASVGLVSSSILNITDVNVSLNFTGSTGFNGDMFVYLSHSSGFSVLLNRTGRTAGNSFGYADAGFNIGLDDAVPNDVHLYQLVANPAGSALTGVWGPDARTEPPASVTDASPRSAFLSSFNGLDANGSWTLFAADLSPVGTQRLTSWSLTITGVPESSSAMFGGAAGLLGLLAIRARSKANR
jgi:subtilisin-like proprotein convertase family protein